MTLNCVNCGNEMDVEREGFDGPVQKISCPQCGATFNTQHAEEGQLWETSDVEDDPPADAACSCECGCDTKLEKGNAMSRRVSDDDDIDDVRILVCLDCYIGQHKAAA